MSKELQPVDLGDYRWTCSSTTRRAPQLISSDQTDYKALHELTLGKREMVADDRESRGEAGIPLLWCGPRFALLPAMP